MRKKNLIWAAILSTSLFTSQALALDLASQLSDEQTESILKQTRESEKYSCSPEDLADYIDVASASMKVRPNVLSSSEFINNQAAMKQEQGIEDCSMNFANMEVVKDIKKLIEQVKNFQIPSPPSSDPVWPMVQQLANQVYDALLQGVCGAMTEELAMELVNEIMDHELGFDLSDVKEFDKNEFALEAAEDYLENEKGIDGDVLDKEEWDDLFGDETKDIYEDQKESMMDNMFD